MLYPCFTVLCISGVVRVYVGGGYAHAGKPIGLLESIAKPLKVQKWRAQGSDSWCTGFLHHVEVLRRLDEVLCIGVQDIVTHAFCLSSFFFFFSKPSTVTDEAITYGRVVHL